MGETLFDSEYVRDARQLLRFFDITTESKILGVATSTVPEASGNFCSRGGRYGTHSTNENLTPIYYRRLVFVAYFNAGVRAIDVRDPFNLGKEAWLLHPQPLPTKPISAALARVRSGVLQKSPFKPTTCGSR